MPELKYAAFLNLLKNKGESNYIGAVLVTDFFGVPNEFRCTHPVKPTEIQRQLYGSTLERHIGVELCGKPLLLALQKKPSLVLVKMQFLLSVREGSASPVLFVRRSGDVLKVADPAGGLSLERKVDPQDSAFESVMVRVHENYSEDLDKSGSLMMSYFTTWIPSNPLTEWHGQSRR